MIFRLLVFWLIRGRTQVPSGTSTTPQPQGAFSDAFSDAFDN